MRRTTAPGKQEDFAGATCRVTVMVMLDPREPPRRVVVEVVDLARQHDEGELVTPVYYSPANFAEYVQELAAVNDRVQEVVRRFARTLLATPEDRPTYQYGSLRYPLEDQERRSPTEKWPKWRSS